VAAVGYQWGGGGGRAPGEVDLTMYGCSVNDSKMRRKCNTNLL
jgi:hypothetical protein